MKENEYQCSNCRGIFEKAWTDEEANQEAEQFGVKQASAHPDMAIVCEDCYHKIMQCAHS